MDLKQLGMNLVKKRVNNKTGVKQCEQQWNDDKLWLVTEWDADGKQTLQYDNEGSMGE
jgi:hypothetical protein